MWSITQYLHPSGSVNMLEGPKESDLGYFQETVGRNSLLWVFPPLLQLSSKLFCLLYVKLLHIFIVGLRMLNIYLNYVIITKFEQVRNILCFEYYINNSIVFPSINLMENHRLYQNCLFVIHIILVFFILQYCFS